MPPVGPDGQPIPHYPDETLQSRAADAKAAAQFCRTLAAEYSRVDRDSDTIAGRIWTTDQGEGVAKLRELYKAWDGIFAGAAASLETAAKQLDSQATDWTNTYNKQVADAKNKKKGGS